MAPIRDAQTLLSGYRTKYPRYKDVDDATLLGAIQKKYPAYKDVSLQTIPNTESFLEKAIKTAGLFVPQSKDEWSDVPKIAANAVGVPLLKLSPPMQAIEAGSKQFGYPSVNEKLDKALEPKGEWGKEMNTLVTRAQVAIPTGIGIKNVIKGSGQFIGRAMADPKEFAYTASKAIESTRESLLNVAKGKFGEAFKKISPTMVRADFDDIVLKSVDDIAEGSQEAAQQMSTIPSSDVSKLYKLGEDIPDGVTLTKEFIQAKYGEIYKSLSSRGKAIFLNHFSENIKGTAQGLDEAKKAIAPVYKIAKGKTPITETNIRMVASGKFPKSKIADLIAKEKDIGTSYVKEAKDIAGAKKITKGVGTVAGIGTGLEFLRRQFSKLGGN